MYFPSYFCRVVRPVALLVTLGCAGGVPDDGDGADAAAPADTAAAMADTGRAAADSGLDARLAAIRSGLDGMIVQAANDPGTARQQAVELYVGQMERIEERYATRSGNTGPLAEEVDRAEERFHDLMDLLGADPPPDSTAVAEAVGALEEQLDAVERAADEESAPAGEEAGA